MQFYRVASIARRHPLPSLKYTRYTYRYYRPISIRHPAAWKCLNACMQYSHIFPIVRCLLFSGKSLPLHPLKQVYNEKKMIVPHEGCSMHACIFATKCINYDRYYASIGMNEWMTVLSFILENEPRNVYYNRKSSYISMIFRISLIAVKHM